MVASSYTEGDTGAVPLPERLPPPLRLSKPLPRAADGRRDRNPTQGPQIIYRSAPDLGIAIRASTELPNSITDPDAGERSMRRSRFLPSRSRGAVVFAISQPEDVDVNEILFRSTLVNWSFNDKVALIHETEATSALSLLTSNSIKAVADLLTVLSQALSRKPWPSGPQGSCMKKMYQLRKSCAGWVRAYSPNTLGCGAFNIARRLTRS